MWFRTTAETKTCLCLCTACFRHKCGFLISWLFVMNDLFCFFRTSNNNQTSRLSIWAKKKKKVRNPSTFSFFSWRMFFSYLFPLLSSWQGETLARCSNFIRCVVACKTVWGGWVSKWIISKIFRTCSKWAYFIQRSTIPPPPPPPHACVPLNVSSSYRDSRKHDSKWNCPSLVCSNSKSFMFSSSFTSAQDAHHADATTGSSVKLGDRTPIFLKHLSSWYCRPAICSCNLFCVPLKCWCKGASMSLLAMDFRWNVPFSVHPAYMWPDLIGRDYRVFIFRQGVGINPVGALLP